MGNEGLLDAIHALESSPYEHAIIEKFECLDKLLASIIGDLDRFDRDGMWAVCGATSLHNWLSTACRRSKGDAAHLVRTTRLLRAVPHVADSLAEGTIAKGHIDVIAANVTDRNLSEFVAAGPDLVARLGDLSVADATTVMKLWAERAKEALGERDRKPLPEETDHLHVSSMLDNTFKLDGLLTGDNAATVNAALARCLPEPTEGEPVRTFAQRQANALVEMARRVLQVTDTTVRRSTDVLLLVPFDTYVNGGVATYADGTIVSPDRVRQLLCDAVITPLLQGEAGQPLWMGQSVRTATAAQRRALVARDRHCAFPGCRRSATWTDAHHVDEWERDDGPTDIDNLCLLCSTHHTLLHKPGWHTKLTPDQTLEVTTPDGRVLRGPPREHLHRDVNKPRHHRSNTRTPSFG
jgi:hypothetical protein